MTLVEKKFDTPVLIKDGYITIDIPEWELRIIQAVKRTKGKGATNIISEPLPLHKEIILFLLRYYSLEWTVKQIHYSINELRTKNGFKRWAFSSVQGRISELQYHGVVEIVRPPKWYKVVPERAQAVLETNSFVKKLSDSTMKNVCIKS